VSTVAEHANAEQDNFETFTVACGTDAPKSICCDFGASASYVARVSTPALRADQRDDLALASLTFRARAIREQAGLLRRTYQRLKSTLSGASIFRKADFRQRKSVAYHH
jgi:hypothetical protein